LTNVATFKSVRNPSTALVVVDNMTTKEALGLHTSVKERGRGAVKQFVEGETIYGSYSHYYYQLKKLGVMPLSQRGKKSTALVGQTKKVSPPSVVADLEQRIKQLEMQLQVAKVSPAQRALNILSADLNNLGDKSRIFLCAIVSRNSAGLSAKQEKWMSDLEGRTL
jgi:hypothetical protein